jgi:hypothetical protein
MQASPLPLPLPLSTVLLATPTPSPLPLLRHDSTDPLPPARLPLAVLPLPPLRDTQSVPSWPLLPSHLYHCKHLTFATANTRPSRSTATRIHVCHRLSCHSHHSKTRGQSPPSHCNHLTFATANLPSIDRPAAGQIRVWIVLPPPPLLHLHSRLV